LLTPWTAAASSVLTSFSNSFVIGTSGTRPRPNSSTAVSVMRTEPSRHRWTFNPWAIHARKSSGLILKN
jgi:hypothetical protein